MHSVPRLEQKNIWNGIFSSVLLFSSKKRKRAVYRLCIKLLGGLIKISLFFSSPHILSTLFQSPRSTNSALSSTRSWSGIFLTFEASTEVFQEGSRTKGAVIFGLALEDGLGHLPGGHSAYATQDYMWPEGTES